MAIQYIPIKIDDVDNTYYTQAIQHSTQILNPGSVPALAPDSGQWFVDSAATELAAVDLVVKSETSPGTPPTLYGHVGMLFSFTIPSTVTIITGYKFELNVTQYQPVVTGTGDGSLSIYVMNYGTGAWTKIGASLPASALVQPWQFEISGQGDMTADYVYAGQMYFMLFEEGADSTSTEMQVDLDFTTLTLYTESGSPTPAQFLKAVKDRVRALTNFYGELILPDAQLDILVDVAKDEVGNALVNSINLANKYHYLAVIYFSCYLSMVAVYGPGIKSYEQDDNRISFGDPYTKSKASWYLDQFAANLRKAGGVITKSRYDIRTYVPPNPLTQDLKKLPTTCDQPQLDDLPGGCDDCPN